MSIKQGWSIQLNTMEQLNNVCQESLNDLRKYTEYRSNE